MGTTVNHIEQARKLRTRAEECRALASLADQQTAAAYLRLAESYDKLALAEEQTGEQLMRSP